VARSVPCYQGMKFAVPKWEGRISPVFDVADNILLVDASDGCEHRRQEVRLTTDDPFERARLLRTLGTDVLICGMLSLPQQRALVSVGIRIIPYIRGDVGEVIEAFLKGQLDKQQLVMPGCPRRRFRKRRDRICGFGTRLEP
jgi:predicted Fe-Mo cluster-binding NifX family protein